MEDLLTKNRVREEFDGHNVGSEVYEALGEEVKRLIEDAQERADDNGRKTVKSRDV